MIENMKKNKTMIILTGPTAVGKTSLSIELAKAIGGEIISADSMQVYKKMDIGTAKIMAHEMEGIQHYLVDELDPADEFNVVVFQNMAKKALEEIYAKGKIPIIVGGTGFYIQALLYDIDFSVHEETETYREELRKLSEVKGKDYLHEMLEKVDPEYAREVHANNVKKVIRALEYYHETGEKLSEHNKEQRKKESPYQFLYYVLTHDRKVLYDRIDKRVDLMMEQGLLEEVTKLTQEGYGKELVSMQGLGYKEFFDYFEGKESLEDTVERIKRDTRHFAKRQLTWFRREKEVIWLDKSQYQDEQEILKRMLLEIEELEKNEQ